MKIVVKAISKSDCGESMINYDVIFEDVRKLVETQKAKKQDNLVILDSILSILHKEIPKYRWIGYYFFIKSANELALGPFRGAKTEHVKIPVGVGVCGDVAKTLKSVIVDDVSKLSNYLSCSLFVKSEIVVPVLKGKGTESCELLAEIDIDGHELSAFNDDDRIFLEKIAVIIADIIPIF